MAITDTTPENQIPGNNDGRAAKPPFATYKPPGDFPLEALPELIRYAVVEACEIVQVPAAIAVQAALCAVSVACQDLITVRRRSNLEGACSLFMLVLAESGDRKSAVDKLFTRTIRAYQARATSPGKQENAKLELQALSAEYQRLIRRNEPTEDVEYRLHLAREKARQFKLLYSNVTPAAIVRDLACNWPSAGIFSSEAASILNGPTMSDLALYDDLWDGALVDWSRRQESFSIEDGRLTISLMIQPYAFEEFMRKRGRKAKGIGFFARTLIARPESLQGTRQLTGVRELRSPWLDNFNKRIQDLLEATPKRIEQRSSRRRSLTFSHKAYECWERDFNDVESRLGAGGEFHGLGDFASKFSENVARMAALFHFFEAKEDSGDVIQEPTVRQAIEVCNWYGSQFRKVIYPNFLPPEEKAQYTASQIFAWLGRAYAEPWRYPKLMRGYYSKREICQYAHIEGADFEMALEVLKNYTDVGIVPGLRGGTQIVYPASLFAGAGLQQWQKNNPHGSLWDAVLPRERKNHDTKDWGISDRQTRVSEAELLQDSNIDTRAATAAGSENGSSPIGGTSAEQKAGETLDSEQLQAVRQYLMKQAMEDGIGPISITARRIDDASASEDGG